MKKIVCFVAMILTASLLLTSCDTIGGTTSPDGTAQGTPDTVSPAPTPDPVQEQLDGMTEDEKIGQLIIAGFDGTEADRDVQTLIEDYRVGGVILFAYNIESADQLVALTNSLKTLNSDNVPLFISVDEEGGSVSRMPDELDTIPSAKVIGNRDSTDLCYKTGRLMADMLGEFGINMDYAPVLDVLSNPQNTVIGNRAYGTNSETVAELGTAVMRGIGGGGVIPVVKHFPGHGDTATDSHTELPVVTKTADELEDLEFAPFAAAISDGADAVMVSHILLKSIDDEYPASLSEKAVTGLLRGEMGFDGVVITDSLTMGAITKNYDVDEAAVLAISAGCDMVMVCDGQSNIIGTYNAIKQAVADGTISQERLDQSVYRILALKQKYEISNAAVGAPDVEAINDRIESLLS